MKTLVFILLALPGLAQDVPREALQVVLHDSSHNAILRKYIDDHKQFGISPDKTVLRIHSTYCEEVDSFSHKWMLGATGRYYEGKEELPTCVAKIDGYMVLIWFNYYSFQFKGYSEAYKRYIAQVYARLERPVSEIRTRKNLNRDGTYETVTYEVKPGSEKYGTWFVTFTVDGKATIKRAL